MLHKPAGLLIPAAASPDSCAMVESTCTLSWPQESVQVLQHRVNHGNMPFPSPPYLALPSTSPKFEIFSDNYQPSMLPDNDSVSSVIPKLEPISPSCMHHQYQQPLHSNTSNTMETGGVMCVEIRGPGLHQQPMLPALTSTRKVRRAAMKETR